MNHKQKKQIMKNRNMKYYLLLIVIWGLPLFISTANAAQDWTNTDETADSLSLQSYLNAVGKKNLDFLAQKYNVSIAEAEVIAQKVLPDPELMLEGANENYSVGIGYTLELGNKRGARVKLAKSQSEMEKLALEYFYQELRAEAAEMFFDAIQQRELLELKKNSYSYMKKISESDSLRLALGEINQIDANLSKLEAATLLNELYEQEAAYKSAIASLNQFMGQSAQTMIEVWGNWNDIKRNYILSDLLYIGAENRVDLLAAQQATVVATNQLQLTKAERKMDLGLSLSYEKEWGRFMPQSKYVKAGISVPIKFSNTNKGALNANKFEIEKSKIEKQSTELRVETDITQAFFFFEAAQKKVKQYQTGLMEDAQIVLDGMAYKYQRGETDITELLVAQRTYNEVQEQYIDSMKAYASAIVNLQKSCGIWDIEM